MDADDRLDDDDEPSGRWVDPDDRLWRHPSEVDSTPWPSATAPALVAPAATAGRHHDGRVWTIAVCSGVIGAVLASGVILATGRFQRHNTIVRPFEQLVMPNSASTTALAAAVDPPAVAAAHRLRPAIVQVQVDGDRGHTTGSGLMLRSDGHVVTTDHLVEGASRVVVVTADGHAVEGRIVGGDPDTDIAVLRISQTGKGDFPVAPIGSAGNLKVGQPVVAIGAPTGAGGGPSVTSGVVSAVGREVEPHMGPALLDMIETDAPITEASSGGALVGDDGSVIGITTNVAGDSSGLGFAVPIDVARDVADQLIQTGRVVHVWMGVEGEDVDSNTASSLSIAGGALVRDVRDSSPAAVAGLRDRDIITAIGGRTVTSIGALMVAVRQMRPGDKVVVTYLRDGKSLACTVTMATRPKNL